MTDIRALAERRECLRDWAGNRAAERDLDGFEALALHIANDAEALSTENAELKRQLSRVDSMCASLWYDGMGGLYDGDNDAIIKEAWARHAARDPDFKRDFDAHVRPSDTGKE